MGSIERVSMDGIEKTFLVLFGGVLAFKRVCQEGNRRCIRVCERCIKRVCSKGVSRGVLWWYLVQMCIARVFVLLSTVMFEQHSTRIHRPLIVAAIAVGR